MTKINIRTPAASHTKPASLFASVVFPDDVFCECFSDLKTPREHWHSIISAMEAAGTEVLNKRQDRAKRMRHEDGATYNPFNDPTGKGIPWALEMIPMPFTEKEWTVLESGILQRAQLLEKILADIYGPQQLIKEGRLPPELVFANPRFLHPCHGILPAGNRYLTYYAADLYRAPDGLFRVFRDFGANPSGLGYALENRIIISRILPDLFHKNQVRRLAPFFQAFHNSLVQRASLRQKEPAIVLLSPGPDSPIYFEHALLSRYLGYPLVQGQDLTVRNGRVFLKKLAGLEPVETIFRHIQDSESDAFALRRDAATGAAGLIQAARDRTIDIVNPIGSGFVDTPVLPVFLPALCRLLLGEDLVLQNHPAWWCGTSDGLNYVTANLDSLNVISTMDRQAAPGDSGHETAQIQSAPHAFMATEPVRPSMLPSWDQGRIRARHGLFRVFACATMDGFIVMPGGLSITAADVNTLTNRCRERQLSKDIWVLSNQPIVPFSLMGGLQAIPEFKRSGDLPSRVADHLLWLGRYLERAEGMIRLLRSVLRRISGEARPKDIPELIFLWNLLRMANIIPGPPGNQEGIPRYRELFAQLSDALYRQDRTESVVAVLKQVQEAARNVRDRLSLDSWRVINRLEGFGDRPAADLLEVLDDTLFTLSAFSGLAMESMTRGLGWRFLDIGRRVERAMNQANLIRIGLPQICTGSHSSLEALLEVFDSIMTYRARYRMTFQLAPVLDLLLLDESNPKSLAFQFGQLADHVDHLPREKGGPLPTPEKQMALEMLTAVQSLELSGMICREPGTVTNSLKTFLETMTIRLKDFAQHISAHYLSRIQSTPHFATLIDDSRQ